MGDQMNENQMEKMFPSKRVLNEDASAYVEIGLRRLPLFYEQDSQVSFEKALKPLEGITNYIYRYIKENHTMPNSLIAQRHEMAVIALEVLDKTYMRFLELIERESENQYHKKELMNYLDKKDFDLTKKVEQYILQDEIISKLRCK